MSETKMSSGVRARFAKGDFLFKQDESSHDIYIIQCGKVRIFKTEGGEEIDLDVTGPGGVVGEVAAIDGGKRSASGVAVEDVEAIVVDAENFKKVLDKIPDWFRKIALILVHRLREVDAKIHNTLSGENIDHVAAVIALMTYTSLCELSANGYEFPFKDVENECMDILHMQIADVAKALEDLQKKNLLEVNRGKVIIKDRNALESFGNQTYAKTEEKPAT